MITMIHMLPIITTSMCAILIYIWWAIYAWWNKPTNELLNVELDFLEGVDDTGEQEDDAVDAAEGNDEEAPQDTTPAANDKVIKPTKDQFVRKVVYSAKGRFGTPKYTNANRRAVHDYCVKFMKAAGHRDSHIYRDIPRIINLVFIPSRDEFLQAKRFGNCYQQYSEEFHEILPNSR